MLYIQSKSKRNLKNVEYIYMSSVNGGIHQNAELVECEPLNKYCYNKLAQN